MRRRRRNLPDKVLRDIEGRRNHPSGLSRRARYGIIAVTVIVAVVVVVTLILLAIQAHTGG